MCFFFICVDYEATVVQQEQKDPGRESLFAARAGAAADFFFPTSLCGFFTLRFVSKSGFHPIGHPCTSFLQDPPEMSLFFEESFDEHAHQQATTQLNPSDML